MPRRVHDSDPRQAPLPIEQASAGDTFVPERALLVTALALDHGRLHRGLDASISIAERATGETAFPRLREYVRTAFLAENLAIDHDAQTISAVAPAVPRGAIEHRARVCWGEGAMLAAETYEPSPADDPRAPAIVRDVNGCALYLYRSPPPIAIVRGVVDRSVDASERAREFLIAAIERGTLTRDNPHP